MKSLQLVGRRRDSICIETGNEIPKSTLTLAGKGEMFLMESRIKNLRGVEADFDAFWEDYSLNSSEDGIFEFV